MSKQWAVTKGHDALVYYEKVFTAETAEEANRLADADKHGEGWHSTQTTTEYDSCDILEELTEEFVPDDEPVTITLTPAERNIVLASLRLWQRTAVIEKDITDLASDHTAAGMFMTDNEIDTLIEEKINV